MTEIADSANGNLSYTYSDLDQMTQESSSSANLNYTYDLANRLTSTQIGSGTATTYGYDNVNRLTSITQGSSSAGYSYDNANRLITKTLLNGITENYSYTNANDLSNIIYKNSSNSTIGELDYTHEGNGNYSSISNSLASDDIDPTTSSSSTFNSENQLTSFNGTSLTYDTNGNMTSDGTNTYVWNARNQLVEIKLTSNNTVLASYSYDALGRRSGKTTSQGTYSYLYDGNNVIAETTSSTTNNYFNGLGIDEKLAVNNGTSTYHFMSDQVNSTIGMTDSSENLLSNNSYTPYGTRTKHNSSYAPATV